ncbi:MAG: matrixin family metalloprotease, partial [Candidatus Obscuribacterales bacterium]|nr:matrixin family metalloprotease [Candidatus Obscuribacterales bacterium]
ALSDDDMKKVCLHEVGHALGINGHSSDNHDIMFFSESPSVWPALTKRDKLTIRLLYQGY